MNIPLHKSDLAFQSSIHCTDSPYEGLPLPTSFQPTHIQHSSYFPLHCYSHSSIRFRPDYMDAGAQNPVFSLPCLPGPGDPSAACIELPSVTADAIRGQKRELLVCRSPPEAPPARRGRAALHGGPRHGPHERCVVVALWNAIHGSRGSDTGHGVKHIGHGVRHRSWVGHGF